MKKIFMILLLTTISLFLLSGCTSSKTICPAYPNPSEKTVKLLLKNDIVWLEKQLKLKRKLEKCNE